jgi:hypothetical protein
MGPTPTPTTNSAPLHNWLSTTATPTPTPAEDGKHDVLNTPGGILLGIAALIITLALLVEGYRSKAFPPNDNGRL